MTLRSHEQPWRQWRSALAGPRMHHAWLLTGKAGQGKIAFARAAALELVGRGGAETSPQSHPDIIELTRLPKDDKEEKKRNEGKSFEAKRNITVLQIRAMQQRLTTRPTLGDRRAIILNPADDLEKSAANALLKSLEEPPLGTYFLLIAHRPARLLPTIRSRCRTLRFAALLEDAIDSFLRSEAPDATAEERSAAILAAGGSPGAALGFVRLELGKAGMLMKQILETGDPGQELRGRLAQIIGTRPDRERVQAVLDLARSVLADRVEEAGRSQARAIIDAHSELVALSWQAPTYNFDPGLLTMDIGTLLARAARPRGRADA